MEDISKKKFVGSAIWKMLESFCSKGISMVVSLILARLLAPEEYGVLSIATVFMGLTDILLQQGFSPALVQKKEIKENDYSTVFAICLTSAALLYGVVYLIAPAMASFYESPQVVPVMRVIGITVFFQALGAVRSAVIGREMKFRLMFVCTCVANVVSGIVGVAMAYMGFGVWALVAQQLSQQLVLTVVLYVKVKIKIRMHFDKESFREIMPFSLKVLTSTMMSYVADAAYSLVIGKKYSTSDLAYYNKGCQFPRQFSLYTFGSITSVLLAALSRHADDKERLKQMVRKINITASYIIFPMMVGLAVVAEPFISFLLTDKWLPCAGVLRWQCLYYGVTPMMLTFVQLHLAMGDGGMRIRQESIRMALMFGTLVVFLFVDANVTVLSAAVSIIAVITTLIACVETHRSIHYTLFEQFKDVLPSVLCCVGMAVATWFAGTFVQGTTLKLIVQVSAGVLTYVVLSVVTKNAGFRYLLDVLKSRRKK